MKTYVILTRDGEVTIQADSKIAKENCVIFFKEGEFLALFSFYNIISVRLV